jgi:hypothetical protein
MLQHYEPKEPNIATDYWLEGRCSVPGKERDFPLVYGDQIGYQTFYSMGIRGSFHRSKKKRRYSGPLTSSSVQMKCSRDTL